MKNGKILINQLVIILLIGVFGLTACEKEAQVPAFYSLGISSEAIIEKFEKQGFNFRTIDSVFHQPVTLGISKSSDAVIHLVGPKDNLVTIKIALRLSRQFNKSKLKLLRSYLDEMTRIVFPDWEDSAKWLESNALGLSRSGSRTKIVDKLKITLIMSEKSMIMGLTYGEWDQLPTYDSNKKTWN